MDATPTLRWLYQLVEAYYSAFEAQLAAQGTQLPGYARKKALNWEKFDELLDSMPLPTPMILHNV